MAILTAVQPHAVITPAYRLVFRLEIANRPGMFARVATTVGARGCSLGAIDLVEATPEIHVRDVTVDAPDEKTGQQLHEDLQHLDGVNVRSVSDRAFLILPSMFDKDVVPTIAKAVAAATRAAGLSRRSSLTEA